MADDAKAPTKKAPEKAPEKARASAAPKRKPSPYLKRPAPAPRPRANEAGMTPNYEALYGGAMGILVVLLVLMIPINGEALLTRLTRAMGRAG